MFLFHSGNENSEAENSSDDNYETENSSDDDLPRACFAETLKQRCSKVGQVDDIELYCVPLETVSGPVQRFAFGTEDKEKNKKTILLVGTSGSGKRTFINKLTNYLFDVNEKDSFRFQLIGDKAANQQKKEITIYDIHDHFNNQLSIIDTPSYVEANTNLESLRNREITDLIHKHFFDGIQDLHSIGFIIKATQQELTPTQIFIFDSLVTIFGSEIKNNISFLLTFADGKDMRPVLNAIKNGLHYDRINIKNYIINNEGRLHIAEDWDDDDCNFEGVQMFSNDLCYNSRSLLDELKCWEITAERIKATEIGLKSLIEAELNKIDTGDYNYQKCRLSIGQLATNCKKCQMTCHHICSCEEMSNCAVMDQSRSDGRTCHVCSCLSIEHARQPYR